MLTNIINYTDSLINLPSFFICCGASIVLGFVLAFVYEKLYDDGSKNYILSLILLPIVVQMVIMLVNGNLGAGVAVAGAFALVRFRSMPGTAKEICGIFCAMVIGLATGMGYIGIAVLLTLIVCLIMVITEKTGFGGRTENGKTLKITIPDNLDYTNIFDDLFDKYTSTHTLDKVRTTNMGAMYELTYTVTMKSEAEEKQFIDDLRCRNGNLSIILSRPVSRELNEL